MLAKQYRLKERGDFRRIYQRGKSLACPYFIMYYKHSSGQISRIGLSASKKLGNAVCRNRQRRRMSELCRHNMQLFSPHTDYVFIIRNAIKKADYTQLEKALYDLFPKKEVKR